MRWIQGRRAGVAGWVSCALMSSFALTSTSCVARPELSGGLEVAETARRPEAECEAGVVAQCASLGVADDRGEGVERDRARANTSYARACDEGRASACRRLGVSHQEARGVPEDHERASALFARACQGGDALGCALLGYNTQEGLGVATNLSRAIGLFRRACDAGEARGCYYLGLRHEDGRVVPRDLARAQTLYRRACEGGVAAACDRIAGEASPEGSVAGPRSTPRVRRTGPISEVQGNISRGEVFHEINRHLSDIQACYERELAHDPDLAGKINVSWVIEPDGLTSNVAVKSSTLPSPAAIECILGVVESMVFVEPRGGSVTVVYPFMFQRRL